MWVWLLVAALVVLAAVATTLLLRARSRRRKWNDELSSATAEVAWFARDLLPPLGRAPSMEQIVGGWRIAVPRITALEAHLTRLQATAPSDDDNATAQMLRDAVRSSRRRVSSVTASTDRTTAGQALAAAAAELEAALARTALATGQPPVSDE